jgi:hypothetical protein
MKAIELYSNDKHEAALGADGNWYTRSYGYNGYGMGWGRWTRLDEAPEYVTELRNHYSGEVQRIDAGLAIHWGFDRLPRRNVGNIRLPNP